jgi:hypothetical protein
MRANAVTYLRAGQIADYLRLFRCERRGGAGYRSSCSVGSPSSVFWGSGEPKSWQVSAGTAAAPAVCGLMRGEGSCESRPRSLRSVGVTRLGTREAGLTTLRWLGWRRFSVETSAVVTLGFAYQLRVA